MKSGVRVVEKIAIIGAGWAGCAAAVEATRLGHQVTVFEPSRTAGGRARRVDVNHNGQTLRLDNGQHILIGAYSETLKLMADMGVDVSSNLLRTPLNLLQPDGSGLKLPFSDFLPAPLDALVGIMRARGWSLADKWSLLKTACVWQLRQFKCPPQQTVADLCRSISPKVMATLIEPLCVSALNTPAARSSGQVFLRVLRDSLFAVSGGSNLLLPKADLTALLPDAALAWLRKQGSQVLLGSRVVSMSPTAQGWSVQTALAATEPAFEFDQLILACPPQDAARLAEASGVNCAGWLNAAKALKYEAITTVYAIASGKRLSQPMLALPSGNDFPAQFVFDRGQLGGPAGLLAFVISASTGEAATLAPLVAAQAKAQLGLDALNIVQTIVEKRATFACTPGLQRPSQQVAPKLLACGDYTEGPYPATLEGAVRSGLQAARLL